MSQHRQIDSVVQELDAFMMRESAVHRTIEQLAARLAEMQIDFALAGGLAVGVHGHLRLTVDVDILITTAGLARFKTAWLGRGYVEKCAGARGVRDSETGVSIDFLITGQFPGDGLPKPVQFPDPATVPLSDGPYRVLDLRTLVELKLASGISTPDRLQDLADVLALIRANSLDDSFSEKLDGSVQAKYRELWAAARHPPRDL